MIEFSIRDGKLTYIAATYSEKILKQLLKYGFVKTTASELCRRSRYKFLLKRLRFKLIKKIAKRLSEKKVFCALREPIE